MKQQKAADDQAVPAVAAAPAFDGAVCERLAKSGWNEVLEKRGVQAQRKLLWNNEWLLANFVQKGSVARIGGCSH